MITCKFYTLPKMMQQQFVANVNVIKSYHSQFINLRKKDSRWSGLLVANLCLLSNTYTQRYMKHLLYMSRKSTWGYHRYHKRKNEQLRYIFIQVVYTLFQSTQFVLHDSVIRCNVRLMDHFKSLSVN